jgi:hypothetical protein
MADRFCGKFWDKWKARRERLGGASHWFATRSLRAPSSHRTSTPVFKWLQ